MIHLPGPHVLLMHLHHLVVIHAAVAHPVMVHHAALRLLRVTSLGGGLRRRRCFSRMVTVVLSLCLQSGQRQGGK